MFVWKQNLMAGQDFDDEELINDLRNRIDNERGGSWACYILDLSMATDLIVSGELEQPLCVQLTTLRPQLCLEKKGSWEITLGRWKIQWGLFVSFNPRKSAQCWRLECYRKAITSQPAVIIRSKSNHWQSNDPRPLCDEKSG